MISQEFRVRMPDDGRMMVRLSYDPDDPWAITLRIDEENVWIFARELLRFGLKEVSGLGDVRIWTAGRDVYMMLDITDERMLLRFDRASVRQFLNRTYGLVLPGSETIDNMDELIRSLVEED